jgi:hypothetical protein
MLSGIGPSVAIVEVKHEPQSSLLDTSTKCSHIVEILTDALALMCCGSLGGIDKEANTHAVPTLLLEETEHVTNRLSVCGHVVSAMILVFAE